MRVVVAFNDTAGGTLIAAKVWRLIAILIAGTLVSACSSGGRQKNTDYSPRVVAYGEPVPQGGGRYKLGSPYRIGDKIYTPRHEPNYARVGIASWYGRDFHGRLTANGEVYDMHRMSAAHPTLPLPSMAEVTNTRTGQRVVVRINDRGPFARGRIIDLSHRAASALGLVQQGTGEVHVRYLGPAPL